MATKKKAAKKAVKKKASKKTSTKKKAAPKKKAATKKKSSVKKKTATKKKSSVKKKATPKKKTAAKKKSVKKKAAKKTVAKKSSQTKKAKPSHQKTAKKTKATKSAVKPGKLRLIRQDQPNLDPSILKIRDRLIANRAELLKLIQASQSVERDAGDLTFSNEIDLASSLEGREMIFQLTSRDRNELKLIEDALFRINNGTYGKCESCEKKITLKRLQIMPLTALCIDCQEAAENI